ncbi:hypothetical protein AaE_008657 [Aphanomyces astaci]|uniref:Protein kinase domain-containing protein n=1 Tax=Aphanomyces astaci TaxID=112090 RepID=A0A6A4ZUD1_APHAT|nr:hypothetical protein AaE_008657 [Aphanomyces astaci]
MDQYRVEKVIANALYGQVLLAHDLHTGDLVAIKKMNVAAAAAHTVVRGDGTSHVPEDIEMEKQVNRLLSNTGNASMHPNILRMRTDFVHGDYDHMVFEYCAGGDLFGVLDHGALSSSVAKRYFQQIASAVAHLHSIGVAHRDLSLENVLLDAHDTCYHTSSMAPEVVRGGHYDPSQADIWSLGIMLFMLVTGAPMCMSASARDSRFKYYTKHGLADLLKSWNMAVDAQAMDLLEKMLRVNPAERVTMPQVLSHAYMGGVNRVTVAAVENVSKTKLQVKAKSASVLHRLFKRKVADAHPLP